MNKSGKPTCNDDVKSGKKLELRSRRIFSEEFKRAKVDDLINKRITVKELSELYDVSKMSVYRWIHKYSAHHKKGTVQVVQMESEATKTKACLEQKAELERIIGQKQIQIAFLTKMIELAEREHGIDIKKNNTTQPLSTSGNTSGNTPTR
ncbi:MAG: transposase [Chitinophagales bacterium]